MKEISIITSFMEKAFINGQTKDNIMETGNSTRCMVQDNSIGLMVGSIMESTKMTKRMAEGRSHGQMERSTLVSGKMVNSMVTVCIKHLIMTLNMENGGEVRELDGFKSTKCQLGFSLHQKAEKV